MSTRSTILSALLLILLAFPSRASEPSDSTDANSLRYRYFYLEGVRQQDMGNYIAAFDLLSHARDISPKSAEVYYTLSGLYYLLGKQDEAKALVDRAASLAPDNYTFMEQQARGLIIAKDVDGAISGYENLYSKWHRRDDLEMLLRLYDYNNDYQGLLKTLNRMETINGSSEQISLSKMHVYEQLGEKEKEVKVLEDLVEKHPNDLGYRVMMGNWMLQNGKPKAALKEYQRVLSEEPGNTAAQLSMLDYYTSQKETAKAESQAYSLLVNPKVDDDVKLTILRQEISTKGVSGDSTAMLGLFKKVLAANSTRPKLFSIYASYMMLRKMPTDSVNVVLRKILTLEPDNSTARIQLIQNNWPKQNYDEDIKESIAGQQYNPDEMAFYYFEGMAAFQKGDKDHALSAFRRGVSQINSKSNADFVSDFYAIMGDILHDKGQTAQAFAAYDSCLQWKPDNVECLNNYAYFLCTSDTALEKAEQMSRKAIDAQPDNGTFLDTYAWILFKEKRFSEALTYIDKALKDSTSSGVVFDHAGDIHALSGDIDGAVGYWQKAIDTGEKSALIERKIRERKYLKE